MGFNVCVAGATGNVGRTMLEILEEQNFPVNRLRLLASARSVGKKLRFRGADIEVEELGLDSFEKGEIVLSSPGASVSRWYVPSAVEAGAMVIDNTGAFRMNPEVPLVVPEVNPEEAFKHAGAYTAFVTSLWRDNQLDEAESLGQIWLAAALQEHSDEQVLWARNVLLRVAHVNHRFDEALAYGEAMIGMDPATDARLVVAQILREQGEDQEALAQIEQFIARTQKPGLRAQARSMKKSIEASAL